MTLTKLQNKYCVRFTKNDDYKLMLKYLTQCFHQSEAITQALHLDIEYMRFHYEIFLNDTFLMNNSICVVDSNDQIVGVRYVGIDSNNKKYDTNNTETLDNFYNKFLKDYPSALPLFGIIEDAKVDMKKELPNEIHTLLRTEIIIVPEQYRGLGIAQLLMKDGTDLLRKRFPDAQGDCAETTNPTALKLFEKNGYKKIRDLSYQTYGIPEVQNSPNKVTCVVTLF
uniref:N-acetyltransferase domain-containing protein n=1 Tax=Rhabditophanes sp. KR3021 TaxID=114890 RepID=A0AC35UC01_9BILA